MTAPTRDAMDPTTRAVSDVLDEYLSRHHGILTSHTNAEDFIAWLSEQGYRVQPAEATSATSEKIARALATATALSGGDALAIVEAAERLAGLTTEWRVRYSDGSTQLVGEVVARDPWPLVDGAVMERREVTGWTADSRPNDFRG